MPVSNEIDASRNLVVTRVSGEVDEDALIEALESVECDERLQPGYRSWFDVSDAEPGEVGAEFVRRAASLATRFDDRVGPVRIAIHAPGDVAFGLGRMYSSLVETLQREVRVFRDAAEAREWLCLTESERDAG